jgi:hypothetical protein
MHKTGIDSFRLEIMENQLSGPIAAHHGCEGALESQPFGGRQRVSRHSAAALQFSDRVRPIIDGKERCLNADVPAH